MQLLGGLPLFRSAVFAQVMNDAPGVFKGSHLCTWMPEPEARWISGNQRRRLRDNVRLGCCRWFCRGSHERLLT